MFIQHKFLPPFSCFLVKEAKNFTTDIFPPSFLVVHDTSRCCQNNITKLQKQWEYKNVIHRKLVKIYLYKKLNLGKTEPSEHLLHKLVQT